MKNYDNIIIGFGQGPKVLANTMTARGESVAVIEASRKRYGGTCFTIGCIPSKELLYASQHPDQALSQKENYRQAVLEKMATVEDLRSVGYHMIADGGADIINGKASFVDEHHVKVTDAAGNETILFGERIIINTGATTAYPEISGLKDSKYAYDSTSIMELFDLPDRLTIIGGGAIGLEMATIYNNFGTQVTVLDTYTSFLPKYDRETADAILANLTAEGIRIFSGATIEEIVDGSHDAEVLFTLGEKEPLSIKADAILVATGRRPQTEGLNLAAAGVEYDDKGIKYNDHLQTNIPHIFVEGDVKGGGQFTYISLSDNRIIADFLYGEKQLTVSKEQAVYPLVLFLNTPVASIGVHEEQVDKANVLTSFLPASGTLRSRITGDTTGFMKTVVDKETHQILGATLYIENSPEVINLLSLAMRENLPYESLTNLTYSHPVTSEMLFFLYNSLV
ncbi:dihydrolipoyl dehydrogenase family protein [Enterococcus sp. HY326]|uniref:dihydrolipoyl dehydrogenase family protein n=1 Tax=Enterococcus sp. HY326 TaxID=2971265 RepID=UPI0022401AD9|nr:FAD-dependent oxidoreductase [Enterococcus sp. HY326]